VPTRPRVDESEILGPFGLSTKDARRLLRSFVDEADRRKRRSQRYLRDISEAA
jgi:hypothetical protein